MVQCIITVAHDTDRKKMETILSQTLSPSIKYQLLGCKLNYVPLLTTSIVSFV